MHIHRVCLCVCVRHYAALHQTMRRRRATNRVDPQYIFARNAYTHNTRQPTYHTYMQTFLYYGVERCRVSICAGRCSTQCNTARKRGADEPKSSAFHFARRRRQRPCSRNDVKKTGVCVNCLAHRINAIYARILSELSAGHWAMRCVQARSVARANEHAVR